VKRVPRPAPIVHSIATPYNYVSFVVSDVLDLANVA
jgi:hypothetical protein